MISKHLFEQDIKSCYKPEVFDCLSNNLPSVLNQSCTCWDLNHNTLVRRELLAFVFIMHLPLAHVMGGTVKEWLAHWTPF